MNTKNIKLRSVKIDDLQLIRDWRNDSDIYQFNKQFNLLNMKNQYDWFKKLKIDSIERKMFIIEESTIPVGICGIINIDHETHSGEIAIIIGNTQLHKKGIGTMVLEKLIQYGFKKLKLHRIGAEIFDTNLVSKKFFEKFNFKHEITFRDSLWRNNRFWDIHYYSLLKNE